uniref:Uncharacterized protein n=1 Tax=Saccharomonospora piscinae TaxID=687388 RepID=W5VMS5_SACPI|nr:hypothetical protein [Saccharomonospora piscinae]
MRTDVGGVGRAAAQPSCHGAVRVARGSHRRRTVARVARSTTRRHHEGPIEIEVSLRDDHLVFPVLTSTLGWDTLRRECAEATTVG